MGEWIRAALYFGLGVIFAVGVIAGQEGIAGQILTEYREDILFLTGQHIELVAISGGLAILVGIPLGILLSRPSMKRFSEPVMQILNIGTTIPTLAILALSMSLLGIGALPAIFALWAATLLPIVRNTYAGMIAVPAFLKEAATGMGMTRAQVLRKVEIPNALFVIYAGIRTAMAINVGTVPLAFLIGGGGLGELIFTGIDLDDMAMLLAGSVPVALLAMLLDFTLGQIQYWSLPRGVNPLRK